MKSFFSVLLALSLFAFSYLPSQTLVSGGIYSNTTWTLSNSPYLMTGPVVVFPGKTLTIEPGVEVRADCPDSTNNGTWYYLEIRGSLVAVGTPSLPIVFKGATRPTNYSWMGINVKATQGGNLTMNYFELSNSYYGIYADQQGAPAWDLNNCVFTYNNYAVQPFGPMNFFDCSFRNNGQAIGSGWQVNHTIVAKRCEFRENYSCNGFQSYFSVDSCVVSDNINGIFYANGPVTNTLFERNAQAIYGVNGPVTKCVFEKNHQGLVSFMGTADSCSFYQNGKAAEVAEGGRISNSLFLNDTVAITFAGSLTANVPRPVVLMNEICGSVNYYVENLSDVNFPIDQNCFCETDSAIIEGLIFDGYDDFTRGLFNYTIYDSTCQNVLAVVQKVNIPASAQEAFSGKFQVYPVPAGDRVFLSVPAEKVASNLSAGLFDVHGRQLLENRRLDSPEMDWDLSAFPSGIYFLRISGSENATLRFVK